MHTLQGEIAKLFTPEEQQALEQQRNSVSFECMTLEITRRCNMHCRHCLRGSAENVDMSRKTALKAINMANDINEIVLTGGEPTLAIDMIQYIYDILLSKFGAYNLPPFFIATNGLKHQLELATILMQWYANCREQEMCTVEMSEDIFHAECDVPEYDYLSSLSFYNRDKKHNLSETEDEASWIVAEGRATSMAKVPGVPRKEINHKTPLAVEVYNGHVCIGDVCYISADERVISSCDCSYENIRAHCQCMLDDLPNLKAV